MMQYDLDLQTLFKVTVYPLVKGTPVGDVWPRLNQMERCTPENDFSYNSGMTFTFDH